jgi:hypothetical protein
MSFLKSKHSGWTWDLKRTPFTGGGGGGQSGPSQTNVQNTNIPEYARPYVETMLGSAQQQIYNYDDQGNASGFKGYTPYGATVDSSGNITNSAQEQANAAVAPFSPLQQMSFYNAANMRVPGQYNTGTGYAALGGMGAANVADRAAQVGNQYNMMATNPYATQAFMSPYIQSALQPQLQEMNRQYDITGNQMRAKSVGQGAFGGNRASLEQAENQRNKNTAMNQAIGSGYQNAFQAAQQAQQYGANLGLQGYNTALQGTGQLTQAGTAMANIGNQQLQAQQGIIGLQNQMGSQMQTQEQNKVNQAIQNYAMQQQYPMQQLSAMSGLLRGLPLQSATTQSYQAAPSAISQISGLGLTGAAAYGLMKKEGGVIKSYAEGGAIDSDDTENFVSGGISQAISRKVLMNPDGYSKQTIDRSTKNGLVDDIVGLAAIQQKNKDDKERQAAAAMAQGTPPSIKDQILAERAALDQQRQQGIEMAQSNLPTEYAGGGIIAFDEGGGVDGGYSDLGIPMVTSSNMGNLATITPGSPEALLANKQISQDEFNKMKGREAVSTTTAVAPAAKKDTGIRILDSAPAAKPTTKLSQITGAPAETDAGASGIDALIKQLTGDIKESNKVNADARKEAKLMGLLGAGLGIMGGTSQYAAANFKGALPALQGYQEEMRGIRSDESKQIAQLAALNLKGAELKQELKKMGITEAHYRDQAKLMAAQANYYNQRGAGGSAGLGSVPFGEFRKLKEEYNGYYSSPKTLMNAPFAQYFDKSTINGLKATPGTESYNSAMAAAKRIGEQHRQSIMQEGMQYSSKQRVASPVED